MIPFFTFNFKKNEIKEKIIYSIEALIDSEKYILGHNTSVFQKKYSELTNSKYCVGVGSGLDALIISLKSLGIQKGDEVIVPSNTYVASWLAVSSVGATIVPVEPDIRTYNIDPDLIEEKITKKTKAILPVHLYGQACDMNRIMEIAKANNLFVIEDNAQAHLAKWAGKHTGTFGNINATSFYPTKNIGAIGEAGAITTNQESLYNFAKKYRNYGSEIRYNNEIKGVNSRIDEIQAAILNIKLKYVADMTKERIKNASIYNALLADINIILPYTNPHAKHVYHLYVIRHKRRDKLKDFLYKKGIQTDIHYPIIPQHQKAYSDQYFKKSPISYEIASTCLSLPIYPGLKKSQIQHICKSIEEFCENDK